MNESAESPPLFASKWAFRFGAALLVAITLVVVLAALDRMQRARLESISETTAVGDGNYFKLPADAKALPVRGPSFKATNLVVTAMEKVEVRDTHVMLVAAGVVGGVSVYTLSASATSEERERAGSGFLLKIAPGEYVRAQATAP